MATTYIARKSLSSTNILSQLNGLSITGYTPGAIQPLSLLSEDRKTDPDEKLHYVDRVSIFQACAYLAIKYAYLYNAYFS